MRTGPYTAVPSRRGTSPREERGEAHPEHPHGCRAADGWPSPLRSGSHRIICKASSSCRIGLVCGSCPLARRFLLVLLAASAATLRAALTGWLSRCSAPSPGRSPFPRWPQMVVSSFSCLVFLQGTCTPFTSCPYWAHARGRSKPLIAVFSEINVPRSRSGGLKRWQNNPCGDTARWYRCVR